MSPQISNQSIRAHTRSALFEVEMVLHELPRSASQPSVAIAKLQSDWQTLSEVLTERDLELAFEQALELRKRASQLFKPLCIL
jgi:hypothetical protein